MLRRVVNFLGKLSLELILMFESKRCFVPKAGEQVYSSHLFTESRKMV